jgi:hypothetical protein
MGNDYCAAEGEIAAKREKSTKCENVNFHIFIFIVCFSHLTDLAYFTNTT